MNSSNRRSQQLDLDIDHQLLEALFTSADSQKDRSGLFSRIHRILEKIVGFLSGEHELRIWTHHRYGVQIWFARDTVSGQIKQFPSEQALRCWLDQRYYD